MSDSHDDLLTRARLDLDRDGVRALSGDLAAALTHASPVRRRRGRRVALGLAALAVAVPTTAAATGSLDGLRTGLFGQPDKHTEDAGTSEWLNTCSPDYPGVIRQHQPDGPLPAGASWQVATDLFVAQAAANPDCAGGTGAVEQEIGIDARYAFYAKCAWTREAITADDAGDQVRREQAGQELKALANSELNRTIDGGGVVAWDDRIAEAVLAGDLGPARELLPLDCEGSR